MPSILKIVIPAFVCFAAVFIYVCSFSLEVFLSLSALGILIVAQILFLSRRVKVGQYKNSDLAESSDATEKFDLQPENALRLAALDGGDFQRESQSAVIDETDLQEKEPSQEIARQPESEQASPSVATSRTVPEEASVETPSVADKSGEAVKQTTEKAVSKSETSEEAIEAKPEKAEEPTPEKIASDSLTLDEKVEIVIKEIEELLSLKEYKRALRKVDQFLEQHRYTFNNISQAISLIKLKGDCEFYLGNHEKASRIWLLLFNKNYLKPEHPMFFPILENIVEKCGGHKSSLYFLLILLNQYRQSGNLEKVDETYCLLEKIYQDSEEYDHLIKICQSHIAVKEKLGDVAGQLPLLDDLGKLYYDQGNQENSKKCYEQRVILEERLKSESLSPVE